MLTKYISKATSQSLPDSSLLSSLWYFPISSTLFSIPGTLSVTESKLMTCNPNNFLLSLSHFLYKIYLHCRNLHWFHLELTSNRINLPLLVPPALAVWQTCLSHLLPFVLDMTFFTLLKGLNIYYPLKRHCKFSISHSWMTFFWFLFWVWTHSNQKVSHHT